MGFNFGAFAGGVAKGGMDTYVTMQNLKRQDEEMALRKQEAEFRAEQAAREREEYGEKQALRTAAQGTYGAVGKPQTFVGGEMGPVPEGAPQYAVDLAKQNVSPYTAEQAEKDYLAKAKAINFEKGAAAEATGLGIKAGRRAEMQGQREENALGFNQNVLSDLANNGGDIGAVLQKHFIPLYNENKLPGVADGGTAKVVKDAMGGGSSIIITGKDGKESVMPADIKTLQLLTGKVQDLMMASSSPANYWKAKAQGVQESELAIKGRTADTAAAAVDITSKEFKAKMDSGYYSAQAKALVAAANKDNAQSGLYGTMASAAKQNADAGKVMQPFLDQYEKMTPEQKASPAGQALLSDAMLAGAKKSGDVAKLLELNRKPDKSNADAAAWSTVESKLIEQGAKPAEIDAQQSAFMARRGYAPSGAVAAIQQGINPLTKKPLTAAEVADFNKRYPKDAVDVQSLPWMKQETARQTAISAIPR